MPNDPAATATFGSTGPTSIGVSQNTTVGALEFDSGAPSYTITAGGPSLSVSLTVDGAGVLNNSVNAPTLVAAPSSDLIFAGSADAGNATLVVQGSGKLVFQNQATAANATVVLNGGGEILAEGSAGELNVGSIQGTGEILFLLNTNLTVGGLNTDTTFNGPLEEVPGGIGALTKIGTGTLTLLGTSPYSGGTTVSAGTLVGTTTSLGSGAITDNAALVIDQGNDDTFANVIGGTGSFAKQGAGAVTLTGVNTYTGATNINSGTLALGSAGSIASSSGVTVASGATFDLSANAGTAIKTLSGGGSVLLGATTALLISNAATEFSGVIAGNSISSTVEIRTGGAQTFSGVNTYSGLTQIDPGATLALKGGGSIANSQVNVFGGSFDISQTNTGASITALTGAFSVVSLGSKTLTITGTGSSFGGVISDGGIAGGTGGGLTLAAGASVQLENVNTYTGATTVESGARLDVATFLSSIASSSGLNLTGAGATVDISASGGNQTIQDLSGVAGSVITLGSYALTVGTANSTTFAGNLQDGGAAGGTGASLIKQGSGTLTLTGTNTYTGGTTISAGTLVGSTTSFGSGAIADNAALVIDQGTGASFANVIGGTGSFTKQGAGVLELTGDSSAFAGTTTVANGTLIVGIDNTARLGGPVDVMSQATLGGSGTVGSTTVASGGMIAPGNAIGTLHVSGDLTLSAGSIYQVQIDTAGASDQILATGNANVDGSGVAVTKAAGSYLPGTRYTILSATGRVNGTFSTLTQDMPFINLALAYDPNDVYLDVVRNEQTFPSVAATPNQAATAAAVEGLGQGNALYDAIVSQTDAASARQGFDALSGEMHASLKGVFLDDSHIVRDAALERLRAADSPELGSASLAVAPLYATTSASPPSLKDVATEHAAAVWAQSFGSWGTNNGNGNAAGIDSSIGGLISGIDVSVAQRWRVGVLAGYSHTGFDVNGRSSSGSSDDYHIGGYAGSRWGKLGVRLGAAYSWHDIETTRSASFPGFVNQLTADYGAGTAQTFGELSYEIDADRFVIDPFADAAYVSLRTDGFTERGGPAALTASGDTLNSAFTTLGVRAATGFALGATHATARATLGWRHAAGDVEPTSTLTLQGGSPFGISGAPLAEDAAVVEVGLDVAVAPDVTLGLSYDGILADRASDNGVNANFTWKF